MSNGLERESDSAEKAFASGFIVSSGDNRDLETENSLNFFWNNLREHQMFLDADIAVTIRVDGTERDALEIADAWECYVYEPIEEIPHSFAPECRPHTNLEILADLETSDRFTRLGRDYFLASNHLE